MSQDKPGFRSVAYFVNWAIYGRNHHAQDLPVDKLTHVLYAFANVRPESGEVYLTDTWSDLEKHYPTDSWNDTGTNLYGSLKQLNLHKRQHRHLHVLLSIGGWTYSSNFAPATNSPQKLQTFASSAVQLVKDLGLDGLDVDWEYPHNPQEAKQYVDLLATLRAELDRYAQSVGQDGRKFELSVACPAGPSNFEKLDVAGMDRYLDFWNLMAYDYAGSWDATAGHQANLFPSQKHPETTPFSTVAAVDFYTSRGVHPSKMVIGCPLYGRAFADTKGPGQPFQGSGEGSWEQGVWDWKALPRPGSKVEVDEGVGASWCFDGKSGLLGGGKGTMVSFDTVEVAEQKARWVKEKRLGGLMWWESSGDKRGDEAMIHKQVKCLEDAQMERKENVISYPQSKYDNLKNGFQ